MSWPYMWQPNVVETQLLQIGQLVIATVPGEFTTMSGRRVRDAVLKVGIVFFPLLVLSLNIISSRACLNHLQPGSTQPCRQVSFAVYSLPVYHQSA
jgi:hypothetical protein